MSHFVHPTALCESANIGEHTRIWAFAHILPAAHIGKDCNICDHVFIENDVVVGDRVTIKAGVQLWDGIRIEDDVFIGPNATFANDKFPRSKRYQASYPTTRVSRGASIGANATILPGVQIGRNAMVGAGSVVTSNVPPHAQVLGNPARIIGYVNVDARTQPLELGTANRGLEQTPADAPVRHCAVRGVTIHRLTVAEDLRGALSVGEFLRDVPFSPKRYFVVSNVQSKEVRGENAHRQCRQFFVCVSGSVAVVVDDGDIHEEVFLGSPAAGLYVPPMIWTVQYRFSGEACLLVFASEYYDTDDYIRDYEEYLALCKRRG